MATTNDTSSGETHTVGSGVAEMLTSFGVDTVFGIPGVHTLEFYRGIRRAGIRHVLNRSETGAVFAADAYARVTGRPGVALLISGPGVTNAATAVAQAYHDSIPLLIISAVVQRDQLGGAPALHSMPDQHAFMKTITAWSEHVEDPAHLPGLLQRAFAEFGSGRPRPLHIQVPADVLFQESPPLSVEPLATCRPGPAQADVDAAVALLESAERPMLILGGGTVDAGAEAKALAETLAAPVVMTLNGKGVLPDDHPLSLGTRLATPRTIVELGQADVVVAVGTEFCEIDFYYSGMPEFTGKLIRIDLDPAQLNAEVPADLGVCGDSAKTLAAIGDRLEPASGERVQAARRLVAQVRSEDVWWERAEKFAELIPLLAEELPQDAIVAVDSTQLGYIGQQALPAHRARSWLIPSGWGTLGPARPMAIGAAVAAPDRPVFAITGDGGLLFTIGEMAAAPAAGGNVTMILWNNGGYEEMRAEFAHAGIEAMGTDATAHDFAALAHGFGWAAKRPGSLAELRSDLVEAAAGPGQPTLIELSPAVLG